jgi:hypothetical protein
MNTCEYARLVLKGEPAPWPPRNDGPAELQSDLVANPVERAESTACSQAARGLPR